MTNRTIRTSVAVVAALGLSACAPTQVGAPSGTPVADPASFAQELRSASVPTSPRQITFDWTLDEQGSRVSGRGVVRVDAPERIRLDLFGARGDTYLIAALVDEEDRFPTAQAPPVDLPSPSLLWSALGVFEPPREAVLAGATTDGATADVRYRVGDQLFVYAFAADSAGDLRLRRVERAGSRGVLETVTLDYSAAGEVATTRYRDWSAFRELELRVQNVREQAFFPPEIWRPGADSR